MFDIVVSHIFFDSVKPLETPAIPFKVLSGVSVKSMKTELSMTKSLIPRTRSHTNTCMQNNKKNAVTQTTFGHLRRSLCVSDQSSVECQLTENKHRLEGDPLTYRYSM